jgi:glyoxylase-like metal-dependent hydrolase (beta-lactamase superfamily II)
MQRIIVGDVAIDSITERSGPWRAPEAMFPDFEAEAGLRHLRELGPIHYDVALNRLNITYQTFVVRTPRHTILVDTCTGEDKGFPPPMDFPKAPWLEGFRALGLRREDIDFVFSTHLHIDHCGWNTVLENGRWVPTFPRAKYVFHRKEYDFWAAATARGENPPGQVWTMNCEPIAAAGQALMVDDDYSLDDIVTLSLTPGHAPFHCCIDITSRGQRASVIGDLMHHALQCREPDWSTVFCADPAGAARSRRAFFERASEQGTILLPVHVPTPSAGRVRAEGDRFRWEFI